MESNNIEKMFINANLILENKDTVRLEMGSSEYNKFLESIIKDLKRVKQSLRARSKEGASYRKEADRIQSAINAMKYLNNKNTKMINSALISEKNNNLTFDRQCIKNFIKNLK